MSLGSIRSRSGFPALADFSNASGTPLVWDKTNRNAYLLDADDAIIAIGRTLFVDVRRDFEATGNGTTDDTAAIQAAIDSLVSAAPRGGVVFFPPGTYKITSTLVVGDRVGNNFCSLNLLGSGAIATKLQWNGSTSGTMIKWWRNKYNTCQGIGFTNAVAKGTTIGLLFTGPNTGTQCNNIVFTNCNFANFNIGTQGGEVGGEAASELSFINCVWESNNTGYFGTSTGNTINQNFMQCGFAFNTNYGCDLGTSQMGNFWGGNSHGNGIATIRLTGAWQACCHIDSFRFELLPPEVAIEPGSGNSIEISNCLFVTAGAVPTYPVIGGGGAVSHARLTNNTFGTSGESGWLAIGGSTYQNGQLKFLEMSGNYIYGTAAFYIDAGNSGIDKLRYSLRGNFYNSLQHGVEEGVVVWPSRVDRPAQIPSAVEYAAVSTNTPCTLTGAQFAGSDEVAVRMTAALGGAGTLNTPTAADIVAAIPGCVPGMKYRLRIINSSSGAFAWTLTANTGVTLTGTMTIAQNAARTFDVTITSLTAIAVQDVDV